MNTVIIRHATFDDAEQLREISIQTFLETYSSYNSEQNIQLFIQQHFSLDAIKEELSDENNTILFALIDSDIVGYVKLCNKTHELIKKSNAVEVARLYVLQKYIGKGMGNMLMNECFAIAAEKNKQAIWLMVWEKNIKAIEFYTKMGFHKFGEDKFVLGEEIQTDWLMMKQLN